MDLNVEAGNSVDDEVTIVGVSRSTKSRAGKLGRAWTQRWTTFPWNRALVLAAMRSGVAEFWNSRSQLEQGSETMVILKGMQEGLKAMQDGAKKQTEIIASLAVIFAKQAQA